MRKLIFLRRLHFLCNMRQGAIFVDLDHTLIYPKIGRGRNKLFPKTWDDYKINHTLAELLSLVSKSKIMDKIIIVSNQGGIEKGFIDHDFFEKRINAVMDDLQEEYGIIKNVDIDYFYSPHFSKKAYDRKPNPGMAIKAAELHQIFLCNSIMIGDLKSDEEFATNSGMPVYWHVDDLTDLCKRRPEIAAHELFKQLHGPWPERKQALKEIDYGKTEEH